MPTKTKRCLLLVAFVTIACLVVTKDLISRDKVIDTLIFVQSPTKVLQKEEGGSVFRSFYNYPLGSRIVALKPMEEKGKLTNLTPEFAAACSPEISFDAQRILFAGKRTAEDNWNIWEMNIDGSGKIQVTKESGDCFDPAYLPMASVNPPEFADKVRWITFTSTFSRVLDEQGEGLAPSLYVISLSPVQGRGTVLWRTTYNLGGDISPTVLQDGRVLFSSRQRGSFALMAISWAGEDINPFYGTHEGPIMKTMACEMPNRSVVFVESDGNTPDGSGQLARVWLRRPLHSHEVLSNGGGRYRTPHPFPDDGLVVSYTSGAESYGIYLFDFQKGQPGCKIYDDPDWDEVDPIPVCSRPEPMARIPMVEFASVLDLGGFEAAGQLQCMNVYESDRPEATQIKEGQVKWARFIEGVPMPEDQKARLPDTQHAIRDTQYLWPPPFVKTRILGEAPVEEDGSFYVNIVGNTPFYIQILDKDKMALQTMRAWTWVRSGDQRGCIGCHEDKELAPENRATQALIKKQPQFLISPKQER